MTSESFSPAAARSGSLSVADRIAFGNFARAVLIVTAIVGTLDILAAHLHIWAASGNFPTAVFKGIASGAFGRERAMQGGAEMIALGVFFHYFISFAWTLLFFLLCPRLGWLRKNILVTGFGYALFVWSTMNFIVLPLSALHASVPDFANKHTYIGIGVLTVVFALPIAVAAERFYQTRRA